MVEPHPPTSFKVSKFPILDAAYSVDNENAKSREMKRPLHKPNVHPSVFDELHDRTTQMASLARPVGAIFEIAEYVLERS